MYYFLLHYFVQISSERDGKKVDSMCHSLTASYVRARQRVDKNVPVCSFYEVCYCQIFS